MKILTCTFWSLIHQWGCFQKRLYVLVKRLSIVTTTYQDRQCTYKMTFRRIHATFVAVKKQKLLHILSVCAGSHRYPACNAHAPYFYLWSVRICNIFPHKRHYFRKKNVLNIKCVFRFSLLFYQKHFSF